MGFMAFLSNGGLIFPFLEAQKKMFKKEKKGVGKKIKNQTSGSGLLLILYNNSYRRKEKGTEGRKEHPPQEKKKGEVCF
jgi:hypothetical protein